MIEFTVETKGFEDQIDARRDEIIALLKNQLTRINTMLVSRASAKFTGNPITSHTSKAVNSIRALPVEQSADALTAIVQAGGGVVSVNSGGRNVSYFKFLEYGTPPHPIVTVNAKVLRFQIGGNTIFRKSVQHPGTPAYRPMGNTLDENTQAIVDQLKAAAMRGSR